MITRVPHLIVALMAGIAVASLVPGLAQRVRIAVGFDSAPGAAKQQPTSGGEQHMAGAESTDEQQSIVRLTEDQIVAAGIELKAVQEGTLAHRILVPGTIVPHADRIARVAVKLSGTVAELRKRLGDSAVKDEILAIL